jgi:hypothetical protein
MGENGLTDTEWNDIWNGGVAEGKAQCEATHVALVKEAREKALKQFAEWLENQHLYIRSKPEEGVPCVFVGCHILRWADTGEPTVAFNPFNDSPEMELLKSGNLPEEARK